MGIGMALTRPCRLTRECEIILINGCISIYKQLLCCNTRTEFSFVYVGVTINYKCGCKLNELESNGMFYDQLKHNNMKFSSFHYHCSSLSDALLSTCWCIFK